MAFTLDVVQTSNTSPLSITLASGAKLAVATFSNRKASGVAAVTSVQLGGVAMTALTWRNNTTIASQIWYLVDPPTGTQNLTWTSGNLLDRATISSYTVASGKVAAYDGVDVGTTGSSTGPSQSVTPSNQPNVIITTCSHEGAAVMTAKGSGQVGLEPASGDGFYDEGVWNTAHTYEPTTLTSADTQSFTNAASDVWAISCAVFKETAPPAQTVSPGLLDQSATLFAPTVNQAVALSLLDQSSTLFGPTVNQALALGLLDQTSTLFAPTVSLGGGGPQTVSLSLLDQSSVLFAPGVNQAVAVPLLSTVPTLFAPTLNQAVGLLLLSSSPTLFAPTVNEAVSLPLLSQAPSLLSLTISQQVQLGLLNQSPSLFGPTVSQAGGAQTVTLTLLSNIGALFAPTVTSGAPGTPVPDPLAVLVMVHGQAVIQVTEGQAVLGG